MEKNEHGRIEFDGLVIGCCKNLPKKMMVLVKTKPMATIISFSHNHPSKSDVSNDEVKKKRIRN